MPRFEAVVLAAGLSSRMQGFKPLLPMGSGTTLEIVVSMLLDAAVDRVVVVAGHRAPEVAAAALKAGAGPVENAEYASGMYSSVATGVRALSPDVDGFFLLPVDIPLVRAATVRRLAREFLPEKDLILHPCFQGERGHPPLLAGVLVRDIFDHDGEGGLRGLLERIESETREKVREIAVPDEGILADMDTDADYTDLCGRFENLALPTLRECEALMDIVGTPAQTRAHGRAVAKAALALADALEKGGIRTTVLDRDVIERASLVHDLAKGNNHHEAVGGKILLEAGFTAIAQPVALHRELELPAGEPVSESVLVFLADKLVKGTTAMPLERRYGEVLERHGDDPEARAAIEGRLAGARLVAERVGREAGRSPEEIVRAALEES